MKDDIHKDINDKFTPSDDMAPHSYAPMFSDSPWSSIKESFNDCYIQNSSMVFKPKSFIPSKPLIYILESSKDDKTKTQITSVIQMLCSTNPDINR